ncbi:hypothetical protein [Aliivibrio salmonicida]|nr:hypothetical protein [Aliivibrio salmonicida]
MWYKKAKRPKIMVQKWYKQKKNGSKVKQKVAQTWYKINVKTITY